MLIARDVCYDARLICDQSPYTPIPKRMFYSCEKITKETAKCEKVLLTQPPFCLLYYGQILYVRNIIFYLFQLCRNIL